MSTIAISAFVGAATLGGGLAGLFLQGFLPEKHTTDRSRYMLAAIVGLISLLLALALGTLVGSAYTFYATQKSEIETLAARSLQLDLSLAQYGPEAEPLRSALRTTIGGIDAMIWGDGRGGPQEFKAAAVLPKLRGMVARLSALTPATDSQKPLLGAIAADEAQIQQTRLLMSLQLASPISWPLLVVVASWSILLFCGFGILSRLERDNPRRPDVRILCDRERNIPHPRIERAFQWTVQNSLGRDRANDRSTSVTDRAPTVGRNLLTRLADAAVAMARADGLHDRTRTQGHRAHSRRYQPQRRRRRHRAVCVVEDPPSRVINCEAPLAARREFLRGRRRRRRRH